MAAPINGTLPKTHNKWLPTGGLNLSFLHRRSNNKSGRSSSSSSSPCSSPLSPHTIGSKARAKAEKEEEEEELRKVFGRFDADGDGKISPYELRGYFGSIGQHVSHEDVRGAIAELDEDGDEMLDFEEFLRLMRRKGEKGAGEEETMRRAFEVFEMEKGCGCITPKGLQRTLSRLGDEKTYDECVAMIRVFDVDGDGVINFQEFHQMMA